jgi:ABC-type transport system involved in cytochrome c biogenesis permease subunit
MRSTETLLFWTGVVCYAATFIVAVLGAVFHRRRLADAVPLLLSGTLTAHSASLALRWLGSGRLPFVTFFESVSVTCLVAAFGLLALMLSRPKLQNVALPVLPVVFLLLGWASSPAYDMAAPPASLASAWIYVHATFAALGKGSFLVAGGIGALWLWRSRKGAEEAFPAAALDASAFRFVSAGFLFYTIMLISGAIWAHQAWGRYWGWDPVETGCLVTWLVYAAYLHLRFTFPNLRGRFGAWYLIIAAVSTTLLLWLIGMFFATIHAYG